MLKSLLLFVLASGSLTYVATYAVSKQHPDSDCVTQQK